MNPERAATLKARIGQATAIRLSVECLPAIAEALVDIAVSLTPSGPVATVEPATFTTGGTGIEWGRGSRRPQIVCQDGDGRDRCTVLIRAGQCIYESGHDWDHG